jgi:hypothetical protein
MPIPTAGRAIVRTPCVSAKRRLCATLLRIDSAVALPPMRMLAA